MRSKPGPLLMWFHGVGASTDHRRMTQYGLMSRRNHKELQKRSSSAVMGTPFQCALFPGIVGIFAMRGRVRLCVYSMLDSANTGGYVLILPNLLTLFGKRHTSFVGHTSA